jgi:MFS family permease
MTAPAAKADGIWVTFSESPRPVRAIMLGVFVNRLGAFLQTFLVLFLTHKGFTEVQAGFALGVYGAGSVAGVLVGGALSDRIGARLATIVSMSGSAALLLAILYVGNYPALLVVVALVGAVSQLYRPASSALLSELTPKNRQVMIFAMYRLALNLGTTAAPLIGAVLVSISYDLLFWAEAVVSCLYAGIAAVALPRRKIVAEAGPADEVAEGNKGYGVLLRDTRYLLYLLAAFVNAAVYIQYVSTLPLAMRDAGHAIAWYGAMVSLNGFIVITCELLVTKVVQRWPIKVVVATGFALLGAGQALYALPWGLAVFVIGTLVWTLAEIVGGPSVFAYPGMAAPKGLTGRYMGSMQAMFGLGTAVGPAVGVALYHTVGSNVWWMCGLACVVAMAGAWFGMRPPSDEPEPATEPKPATRQAPEEAVSDHTASTTEKAT